MDADDLHRGRFESGCILFRRPDFQCFELMVDNGGVTVAPET
jgi:hypothetical protein